MTYKGNYEFQKVPIQSLKYSGCAWKGCDQFCEMENMPANGWRWLLMFHSRKPLLKFEDAETWDRDTALCPKHAQELNSLLKDIPRAGDS